MPISLQLIVSQRSVHAIQTFLLCGFGKQVDRTLPPL